MYSIHIYAFMHVKLITELINSVCVCQIPETWRSPDRNIGAVGVKVSHRGFEKKIFVLCGSIALELKMNRSYRIFLE